MLVMSPKANTLKLSLIVVKLLIAAASHVAFGAAAEIKLSSRDQLHSTLSVLSNDSLLRLGNRYLRSHSSHDSALVVFNYLVNQSTIPGKVADPETSIRALNSLAYLNMYSFFDYGQAYKNLRRAQTIAETLPGRRRFSKTDFNMSALYQILGALYGDTIMSNLSTAMMRRTIADAAEQKDWPTLLLTFTNLCSKAVFDPNIDISDELYIVEQSRIPAGEPLLDYAQLYGQAVRAVKGGDTAAALRSLDAMRCALAPDNDPHSRFKLVVLTDKIHIFKTIGQADSLLSTLREAMATARTIGNEDVVTSLYEGYADYYDLTGRTYEALQMRLRAYQHRDSIAAKTTANNLERMESLFIVDSVNEELRDLLLWKRQSQWQIAALAIAVVAALSFIIYYRYNYKTAQRRINALYRASSPAHTDTTDGVRATETGAASEGRLPASSELYQRALRYMESTSDIYVSGFRLEDLARNLGVRERVLSEAINKDSGGTFTNLLTKLRIKEACKRMDDHHTYGSYTIEAIAAGVGFRSRTNFSAAFRNYTGLTPSEYLRAARHVRKSDS